MNAYHFDGQTHVLEAPAGHDHEKLEVYGLPVRQSVTAQGVIVQSVWKPTPEELEQLIAGGAVVVSVFGGQPPMDVTTCDGAPLRVEA